MQSFSTTGQASSSFDVCAALDAGDLRMRLDGTTPTFVLIDPMLGEPLPSLIDIGSTDTQIAREAAWNRGVTRIQLGSKVSLPQHQHPYLVALTGLEDTLLGDTFEIANSERLASQYDGLSGDGGAAHRIGGWLQSTLHAEDLAEHLSAIFRVNTSAITNAGYLRIVDRRVLALLCHTVGTGRVSNQFGRLQRWVFMDTLGGLFDLTSGGEMAAPLMLRKDEWQAMEQGEAIHRTVGQWLGQMVIDGKLASLAPSEIFNSAQGAVAQARDAAKQWPHRFQGMADISAYAATCLLHAGLPALKTVHAMLDDPGTVDSPPELLRYLHSEIRQLAIAELDPRRA